MNHNNPLRLPVNTLRESRMAKALPEVHIHGVLVTVITLCDDRRETFRQHRQIIGLQIIILYLQACLQPGLQPGLQADIKHVLPSNIHRGRPVILSNTTPTGHLNEIFFLLFFLYPLYNIHMITPEVRLVPFA